MSRIADYLLGWRSQRAGGLLQSGGWNRPGAGLQHIVPKLTFKVHRSVGSGVSNGCSQVNCPTVFAPDSSICSGIRSQVGRIGCHANFFDGCNCWYTALRRCRSKLDLTNTPHMPLLDLWAKTPDQLEDKQIHQLIAFAGGGKLLDDSPCSAEFREFLATVPSKKLESFSAQCLEQAFPDSGMALQDIVNEIGVRLGAKSIRGRYRGVKNQIGFDGLWKFPAGNSIVVEVKTTDAYRIDLNVVAEYRRKLIVAGETAEETSSILLVVGRQDTGDLEAQIRGSRHAWDVRIISVDALTRLMKIMEDVDDPAIVQRIHSILVPHEFTRLDAIADVLFSTTEEVKQDETPIEIKQSSEEPKVEGIKTSPVAFHEACVKRIQHQLKVSLVKRSRSGYSTPDDAIALNCSVSKEHNPDSNPNYWFAFHPHQQTFLEKHASAYVAFGCGSSERLVLVPYEKFKPWLQNTWVTENGERTYWHVVIYRDDKSYALRLKKGSKAIDLTPYVVANGV